MHPARQANRPLGPRRTSRHTIREAAESTVGPNWPDRSHRPPIPESRRRPTFAGPDPTVTTEEPLRRRQLLSALVLRPPCSRKWPILGGQGVKSLRRVRSVSTISRFWRLFAFAALHVHTTAVPPPPTCWAASHNIPMPTWGVRGSRGGGRAAGLSKTPTRACRARTCVYSTDDRATPLVTSCEVYCMRLRRKTVASWGLHVASTAFQR